MNETVAWLTIKTGFIGMVYLSSEFIEVEGNKLVAIFLVVSMIIDTFREWRKRDE